jgi:predicted TIM-barrel fold metal-dependent hydrolase
MDHAYKRHRYWMKAGEMQKLPSEYFLENIYATFQDDWVALHNIDIMNPRRLLWANDYPHSDSTWPWSHEILGHHLKGLPARQIDRILRENVKELYKLDVETRVSEAAVAH